MASITFEPHVWAGFVVNNREAATAKVARMRSDGKVALRSEVDWDKTIVCGSTWDHVPAVLPGRRRQRHHAQAVHNVAKLRQGSLTAEEAIRWQTDALQRLKGCSHDALLKAVEDIPLRAGAEDFFRVCEQAEVPAIIRSAAIRDAIGVIALKHGIRPSLVLATQLVVNRKGRIRGFRDDTLTHDLNKGDLMHKDLTELISGRHNAVVLGDSMADTLMAPDANAFRIRIDKAFDPSRPDDWEAYLQESFNLRGNPQYPHPYDAVTTSSDLFAVTGLVEYLVGGDAG